MVMRLVVYHVFAIGSAEHTRLRWIKPSVGCVHTVSATKKRNPFFFYVPVVLNDHDYLFIHAKTFYLENLAKLSDKCSLLLFRMQQT